MKKTIIVTFVLVGLIMGLKSVSFASDWDKAGKALTIIEGVRVITGGKVDLIGNITGINKPREEAKECRRVITHEPRHYAPYRHERGYRQKEQHYVSYCKTVWVPHMVWKEKYIPRHTEYRPGYGEVVVEAHIEKYLVEEGGHWEKVYN